MNIQTILIAIPNIFQLTYNIYMIPNIDPELLKQIQVTGITEADYERALKHIEAIKTIESLFFQDFIIYDYFKMEPYFISSHAMEFFETTNILYTDNISNEAKIMNNNMAWNLVRENQNFIKQISPEERKNFVFAYTIPEKLNGIETMLNFKTKMLEAAPDGRIWLELGILTLFPFNEPQKLMAQHITTKDIMEFDLTLNQWMKTSKMTITDLERSILRLSAQGMSVKDISKITFRTQSTIDTHRKNIFKKLHVHNITEAIGYTALFGIL